MPKLRIDNVVKGNIVMHAHGGEDYTVLTDTKANILARSTDTAGTLAYATDTYEFYLYTGSSWYKVPFALVTQSANPDIGSDQDSSAIGIHPDYIVDKNISYSYFGENGWGRLGGFRAITDSDGNEQIQFYKSSAWNNAVVGFTFDEDPDFGYALTHQPDGLDWRYEVMSGNSIYNTALNGLPFIQGYVADMGSEPSYQCVGGRTIA